MNFLKRFLHRRRIKKFWNLQKLILPLINNPIARKYLGVPWDKRIVKVTANSVHFQKNKIQRAAIIYGSPAIKEKGRKVIRTGTTMVMMLLGLGISKNLVLPLIILTTDTFYPDPDPESTSVDGHVQRIIAGGTAWATIHDATRGTMVFDNESEVHGCSLKAGTTTDLWAVIVRAVFLFDTSSLPDNADISEATFSLYIVERNDALSISLGVVSSNPISNTALELADYNKTRFGTTRYATDKTYASLSTGAYNNFSLNTDGKNAISKTGITKFGLRTAPDIDDSPPTWVNNAESCISFYCAEHTGTANDPKLVITYSIPPTLRTIAESMGISDSVARVHSGQRLIQENEGILDSIIRSYVGQRLIQDNLGITDILSWERILNRLIQDDVGITDILTCLKVMARSIQDTVGITDSLTQQSAIARIIADSLGITDAIARDAIFRRLVQDNVGITDLIIKEFIPIAALGWAKAKSSPYPSGKRTSYPSGKFKY